MKQQKQRLWKSVYIISGITGMLLSAVLVYYLAMSSGPIYDFDPDRDTQDILEAFERDRSWLVQSKDYSPEFMLKHRAPRNNPLYVGSLHIKVLREQGKFVGFTAYYMEKKGLGRLLFLAVDPEFRGKGYGEQLIRYVLKEFTDMGAQRVRLFTWTDNFRAQRLYIRVGFREVMRRPDGVMIFEYDL